MSNGQLSQVRSLRLAAWTMFALGVGYAAETLIASSPSWVDRFVEPGSGWGMVLASVRALGHVLAAGILGLALVTLRERWVWWVGVVAALAFGIVDGLHFLFPGRDETVRLTWAVRGALGIALLVLLLLPSSRAAFSRRSA